MLFIKYNLYFNSIEGSIFNRKAEYFKNIKFPLLNASKKKTYEGKIYSKTI